MIIIPTIQLQGGKCVSLTRGRIDAPEVWDVDPVTTARDFGHTGAEWMHVTDFDAITDAGANTGLVTEIIRNAGIPVQVAGGFRTMEHVEKAIDAGAGRVVIGTAAVKDPDFVKRAAKLHPDQIVLAVDVFQGAVAIDGWRTTTAFEPEPFIRAFDGVPLAAILVTDIDQDMGDSDGSVGLISHLAGVARTPVIASGVVRGLDDISRLRYVRNIAGALVGRALFSGAVTLDAALEVVRRDLSEPVAEMI